MKTQELKVELDQLRKTVDEMIDLLYLHPKSKAAHKTFTKKNINDVFDQITQEDSQNAKNIQEILKEVKSLKLQSSTQEASSLNQPAFISTQPLSPFTQSQPSSTQTAATINDMSLEKKKKWPDEPIMIDELLKLVHQSHDDGSVVKAAALKLKDHERWYSTGHYLTSLQLLLAEKSPTTLDLHLTFSRPSRRDLTLVLQDVTRHDIQLRLYGPRDQSYDFVMDTLIQETSKCTLTMFLGMLSPRNLLRIPSTIEELRIVTRFCDLDQIISTFPHLPSLEIFALYFQTETNRLDSSKLPHLPALLPIRNGGVIALASPMELRLDGVRWWCGTVQKLLSQPLGPQPHGLRRWVGGKAQRSPHPPRPDVVLVTYLSNTGEDLGAEGEAVVCCLAQMDIKVRVLVIQNVQPLSGTREAQLRQLAEKDLAVCQKIGFYTHDPSL